MVSVGDVYRATGAYERLLRSTKDRADGTTLVTSDVGWDATWVACLTGLGVRWVSAHGTDGRIAQALLALGLNVLDIKEFCERYNIPQRGH